jgi:hypothetical protein
MLKLVRKQTLDIKKLIFLMTELAKDQILQFKEEQMHKVKVYPLQN